MDNKTEEKIIRAGRRLLEIAIVIFAGRKLKQWQNNKNSNQQSE